MPPAKKIRQRIVYGLLAVFFTAATSCEVSRSALIDEEDELELLVELPGELAESSGIIVYDSLIWTFNDSGNKPELYAVSVSSGEIVKTITIANADNVDWEDITQDSAHIYIGDFGNNDGDRQDLRIYIIEKSGINNEAEQSMMATHITFAYDDQEDFQSSRFANSFDCEAMFVRGDSIYLLSKDWLKESSTLYVMPRKQGSYLASNLETINTQGLVTGADYDSNSQKLLVCGYSDYIPFVLLYDLGPSKTLSKAPVQRIELSGYFGYQIEGVTFFNKHILLTNEISAVSYQAAWLLSLPGD